MSPSVKQMNIEQLAQRLCISQGLDYRNLSDSKKQLYLTQVCAQSEEKWNS
jgi:hypothetical protein